MPYDVKKAWLRAAVYFVVCCFVIGWATGALRAVTSVPLVQAGQAGDWQWVLFTAVCFLIIFTGYFIVWPKGTLTYGRPLIWTAVLPFGLAWGLSEGLLFVSVWYLVNQWFDTAVWTIIVSFLIIGTFKGLWHQFYWDIYVAPEHNILEWNGRKVALAHVPNLTLTLTYLTLHGNMGIFIILQTIALLSSTYFMHFPAFWREDV